MPDERDYILKGDVLAYARELQERADSTYLLSQIERASALEVYRRGDAASGRAIEATADRFKARAEAWASVARELQRMCGQTV